MPTYNMRDTETGEVTSMFMSIAEREEYLKNNPRMKQELAAPPTGDSIRLGITKNPDSFKDVLRNIKSHHYGSNINV